MTQERGERGEGREERGETREMGGEGGGVKVKGTVEKIRESSNEWGR